MSLLLLAGDIITILDKRTELSRNRRRQTVLLSATLHANLGKLATLSLTDPVSVGIRYILLLLNMLKIQPLGYVHD